MQTSIRKIRHYSLQDFERLYIDLRRKENRLHTDAELHSLPEVESSHPFAKEWKLRKYSYLRLASYLQKKRVELNILEAGCGNGWLSARLAWLPNTRVTGLDINLTELKQAQCVFGDVSTLGFVYGDLRENVLNKSRYNIIVFASSIQYFPSVGEIINTALKHLDHDGEIHILDSPFYRVGEIAEAKRRSRIYFGELGIPEMNECYHHHAYADLKAFQPHFLYDPRRFLSRIRHHRHLFPWVVIKTQPA